MGMRRRRFSGLVPALAMLLASGAGIASASNAAPVPDPIPHRSEGVGPFNRVVLRNVTMVDGTGAPPQGPVDIVLSGDRIAEIRTIGAPHAINPGARAAKGDYELDLTGYYVLPGFVDAHAHLHDLNDAQHVPSDYILKLWLANGITSVREVGSSKPIEWLVDIKKRSAANEIAAPRIDVYPFFQAIEKQVPNTPAEARAAIDDAKRRGADGIKFINYIPEDVLWAALDETGKLGMRTAMHHSQQSVAWANALTTSAHGLTSLEHWYGIPESMFTDKAVQHWPNDFVNNDEEERFGESGRLWAQTAVPGSPRWEEVMKTLLERQFVLDPTFVAYLTSRDFMRGSRAIWHADYTMPALWDYYRPNRSNHGSYWYDWTTEDEVDWRHNYELWMQFINEYKNKGGMVTVGDDAGYIYNLYGFGYIQELELLREAGFSPLEVIHAATQQGARLLGHEDQIGTIRVGRKADLVVVKGNPLANLKLLFPTGTIHLDDATGKTERIGGIAWTIKDGILFDGKQLREEIRDMVAKAKASRGLAPGPMPVETVDLTR